ncbi:MAG: hypothetical protein V3W41_14380 [Planctomycetota bacterium]
MDESDIEEIKPSCYNCAFMRRHSGHQSSPAHCHKKSPAVNDHGNAVWPQIYVSMGFDQGDPWCGDHKWGDGDAG